MKGYAACVYLDINTDPVNETLKKLIVKCNKDNSPLIICSDTNAHSCLWNSNETNARGRCLEDFIATHDLYVANQGSCSTFYTQRAESIIDVTMYNQAAFNSSSPRDWMVDKEGTSFSDHRYISFNIDTQTTSNLPEQTRNLRKCNWAKFRETLAGKFPRCCLTVYWSNVLHNICHVFTLSQLARIASYLRSKLRAASV